MTKYSEQQTIIQGVIKGNQSDIKKLLRLYDPLVLKTSSILVNRYGRLIHFADVVQDARYLIIYLTAVEYKPHGKARFPQFLKTHLHARLVQMYRPIAQYRKHLVYMDGKKRQPSFLNPVVHEMLQNERATVCEALEKFVHKTFNNRERAIIDEFICGDVPRNQLAQRFGISAMRMKHVQKSCMKRLRTFLNTLGVKGINDI